MHREPHLPGVQQQPHQPSGACVLRVEGPGVCSDGTLHHLRAGELGQDDYAHIRVTFADLGYGGDAVAGTDMAVHGHEIRLERLDQVKTVGQVRRVTDRLEVGVLSHGGPNHLSKLRLIIDHDYSEHS